VSDSAYDIFLDHCVDDYYDTEEYIEEDDEWLIDMFIEKAIEDEQTGFYSKFIAIYKDLKYECEMKNPEVIKLIELGAA